MHVTRVAYYIIILCICARTTPLTEYNNTIIMIRDDIDRSATSLGTGTPSCCSGAI